MRDRIHPLIDPATVRESGLGVLREQRDVRNQTVEGTRGVVIRVYPVGHPENRLGQTLVDVHLSYLLPILKGVPVALSHAHQETPVATPRTKFRQPYPPKARNRMEGEASDLRPGTFVWVQFMNADLREPIVTAVMPYNRQGEEPFPVEKQVTFRFAGADDVEAVECFPLNSSMEEYPRSVRVYNGTRREIDNRGNLLYQTTIDREPVFLGDNGIPAAPLPEGSEVHSTKGARLGNQGRFTGRHPVTGETNEHGSIVDESLEALIGSHIRRILANEVGNYVREIVGNAVGKSTITVKENGDGSYSALLQTNGAGDYAINIVANGSGKYAVETSANPSGAHEHTSSDNGDGSHIRAATENGDGSIKDIASLNGNGRLERVSSLNGDGSILDEVLTGGIGRIDRRTVTSGDGSIVDEAVGNTVGRIDRRSIGNVDGTVRDQVESTIGNLIKRVKSAVGRFWVSTAGSGDGRLYIETGEEGAERNYLSLDSLQRIAEMHGIEKAVLDSALVKLGNRDAPDNIVLWPQLDVVLQLILQAHDGHGHTNVQNGGGTSGPPTVMLKPIWIAEGPECRSDVAFALKSPAPDPEYQTDPEAG